MTARRWGAAARIAATFIGIALMAAPALLEFGDPASALARICGPIVAALSIVAMSGVLTAVRWATLPVGLVLALAAFPVAEAPASFVLAGAGVVIAALALVPMPARKPFGGGWRAVWRDWRAV